MKSSPICALLASAALLCSVPADACTNLIVGKAASTDGSVMVTYNCDSFGFVSPLTYSAPGRHAAGEMIALRGYGQDAQPRLIAQAPYTYGVVGLMNENQVTIVETTWGGRDELRNPEGYLDYFTLMDLALQRSANAREAIAVIDALVQEYVYGSTGENFVVAD